MTYNNNGNGTIAYNNYRLMPRVPYMIIDRLAEDQSEIANNLWKALKYSTTDCLNKANLTKEEKMKMVWTPESENSSQQNLFSVFLKPLISSSLDDAEQQIQLRIYRYITKPSTLIESVMAYQFDIITQETTSMIYENGFLVERTDYIESCLLDLLNGADIHIGSSFFSFDARMLSGAINSTLSINNSKSMYGRSIRLALRYVDVGIGGECSG